MHLYVHHTKRTHTYTQTQTRACKRVDVLCANAPKTLGALPALSCLSDQGISSSLHHKGPIMVA